MAYLYLAVSLLTVVVWLAAIELHRPNDITRAWHRLSVLGLVVVAGITLAFMYQSDKMLGAVVLITAVCIAPALWIAARTVTVTDDTAARLNPEFGNELHLVDAAEHDAHRSFPTVM